MLSLQLVLVKCVSISRTALKPFIAYCALSTVAYCFPARWIWSNSGWLKQLGVIDNSGCGVVHQMGGFAGSLFAIFTFVVCSCELTI